MPLVLLVLFVVVPLAELYVLIQIGQEIGLIPTLLLLLADSIIGTMLLRSQGRLAWQNFNEATAAGRIPAREVADGFLIILGGSLLLTPGFLTDIFGLLLLIPVTRRMFRNTVVNVFARRSPLGWIGLKAAPHAERAWNDRAARRGGADGDFVEGTATEHRDDEHRDDEPRAGRRQLDP